MNRPLVITDCDEVLLHMVRHFGDWLGEAHGIAFELNANPFETMMQRDGVSMPDAEKWRYLDLFFDTEMGRQTAIEGAVAAIAELRREADVVVLTNLGDRYQALRTAQLREHGIAVPVFTNQGPKGPALQRIVEQHAPSRAVFVDDLAPHLASAAEYLPEVSRLHLCGEPAVAPHIPCAFRAGHAHARIDTWAEALPWLLETLHGARP
ncbi:MAG TPA: HAD family hydrolase [Croceibacterium sp.]